MLDYFLNKGFVKMNEDGSIERTTKCLKNILYKEFPDGIIDFYWDSGTWLTQIREPEDYENTKVVNITPETGINFQNT